MTEKDTITPKQRRAVEALVSTGSRREACRAAGIAPRTLYRWLKQSAFCEALGKAQEQALADLRSRLLALAGRAGDVLEASMRADDARLRLRAADTVLSRLLQVYEAVELTQRVEKLERIVEALEVRHEG